MRALMAVGGLLLVGAIACSSTPPPTPVFVFNRPAQLDHVCVNAQEGADRPDAQPLILPLRCCATYTPVAPRAFFASEKEWRRLCGAGARPELHALVTQSARGEVAAINLAERRVLDADQLIPGYTFVDVGGLPRAIVTPRELYDEDAPTYARGAQWTYIASAGQQAVLAVPTCSFLRSDAADCGPVARARARGWPTLVPLPAAPADMVYTEGSLWVSLPDISSVARIRIGSVTSERRWLAPFAGGAELPEVELLRVPDRGELPISAPISDPSDYRAVCGLGYVPDVSVLEPEEASAMTLPGTARPTRLRIDAETGLLFVADRGQGALHAFSIEGDAVLDRGALRTGAPVRDFALSPAVPAEAPQLSELGTDDWSVSMDVDGQPGRHLPQFAEDSVRYAYAIDDRDGTVLAMTLEVSADGPIAGELLSVPAPIDRARPDRLGILGVATALDVIDTRVRTQPFVCNPADAPPEDTEGTEVGGLERRIERLEADLRDDPTEEEARAIQSVLDALRALEDRATNADGVSLHGVFLAVADSSGTLSIIDIHDEDLFCRASQSCLPGDAHRRLDDERSPPAVLRHAVRRQVMPEPTVTLSDEDPFASLSCREGTFPADADGVSEVAAEGPDIPDEEDEPADGGAGGGDGQPRFLTCLAADPWSPLSATLEIEYEGTFFDGEAPTLTREGGALVLRAAEGFDFCARGVFDDASDGMDAGYLGDYVVVTGSLAARVAGCTEPEPGLEPRMRVLEAYADRLVLAEPVLPVSLASGGRSLEPIDGDDLLRCYPFGVELELRLNDRYLVLVNGQALHHSIIDDAGRCAEDPSLAAQHLSSRLTPGEVFRNPYASFKLRALNPGEAPEQLETSFNINGGSIPLQQSLFGGSAPDISPAQVRYLELTDEIYVLDAKSQGLQRFRTAPLQPDGSVYR